jgi:hypothetical protein
MCTRTTDERALLWWLVPRPHVVAWMREPFVAWRMTNSTLRRLERLGEQVRTRSLHSRRPGLITDRDHSSGEKIMSHNFKNLIVWLLVVLASSGLTFSQATLGTIVGTVTDPSGAVVPSEIQSRAKTESSGLNH